MRILLLISLTICYSSLVYSQSPAIMVYTIDKLPSVIQLKLNSVLSARLFTLESSVHFIDAQIINPDEFLKETDIIKVGGIIPKYDVHYYISIPSLGLNKYNVNIRLDQYGQLISVNGPEKGNPRHLNSSRDYKSGE